jgi:hypothetical protein
LNPFGVVVAKIIVAAVLADVRQLRFTVQLLRQLHEGVRD